MSWAQLLLWSVLLSFASWASILFAINASESHRAVFECDTSEIMSEIDAGFSSCMILDLEDVLHNFEMVMPVPPVVRETHPSARAVVLESGIETYRDVFLSSWTCLGLVGIWTRTWSSDSPNVQVGLDQVQQYMLFFLFQNKTI